MGQIVIELPQEVNRTYYIKDAKKAEQVLRDLEALAKESSKISAILPPRRNSLKEDSAEAFGIWANRNESAEEISRRIRDLNNGKDV